MHALDNRCESAVLRFLAAEVDHEHVGAEWRKGSGGWMLMADLYYGYLRWALGHDELLLTGLQFGAVLKRHVLHRRDLRGIMYKARPKRADYAPAPRRDIVAMHRAAVKKRRALSKTPPADGTRAEPPADGTGAAP